MPHKNPHTEIQHMVGLREDMNPEYYQMQAEAQSLFDRWNALNVMLSPFRLKSVPFLNSRSQLKKIFEPYAQLAADSNRWLSWADGFFRKHSPSFEAGQDATLNLLWLQHRLDRQIDSMQVNKFINHYVYQRYSDAIDKRQNFQIALLSFLIALAGLIVALGS